MYHIFSHIEYFILNAEKKTHRNIPATEADPLGKICNLGTSKKQMCMPRSENS